MRKQLLLFKKSILYNLNSGIPSLMNQIKFELKKIFLLELDGARYETLALI